MDPASDRLSDSVTVLARTNEELSPGSARDYIQWRENTTALPIHPQGGTVYSCTTTIALGKKVSL